jgi:hypothetical protein
VRYFLFRKSRTAVFMGTILAIMGAGGTPGTPLFAQSRGGNSGRGGGHGGGGGAQHIQSVFIILMENHNWSQIKGSSSAPYISDTLLPEASYANQYYNPPNIHPSLPNYL